MNHKAVIDRRLRPLCVATWEVTLSARKVVRCVRWPATGINAHSLYLSSRLRVSSASAGRRRQATLAYRQKRDVIRKYTTYNYAARGGPSHGHR